MTEQNRKWSKAPIHDQVRQAGLDDAGDAQALSDPSGSEPLRIALSREEIEDKAKAYLLEYFDGKPNDDFYLRLGMMVDFSHFLFQNSD